MAKRPLTEAKEVPVANRAELRAWLAENHTHTDGVWIVRFKKAHPDFLPTEDVIKEALSWGWVDSLVRTKDEMRTMNYIAPRKEGSNWSALNKSFVAELDAEGLIAPPGQAAIDRAKADGTWTALDDVENLVIPPDLQAAFDANPGAETNWHAFPRSPKRGILEWILNAKRPETRAKRIAETAEMAARNERANQWR